MNFARFARAAAASVVVATVAFGVAACGDGRDPKMANITPGAMPEGESWNGVYFHPVYGYLHLSEEGGNIVGRWRRADQSQWGELSGTISGNVIHYTWKEHKNGGMAFGAAATVHGKGYFVYKLDEQKHAVLDGQFGMNDAEVGTDWHNVKQARMLPDLKSIGGDAEGGGGNAF